MGDEDAVDVVDGSFDRGEAGKRFAFAETRIYEEAGALGLEQSDVARTARRQDGNPQADRFPLKDLVRTDFQNNATLPDKMPNKISMNHCRAPEQPFPKME